jgi:hypothetical protein
MKLSSWSPAALSVIGIAKGSVVVRNTANTATRWSWCSAGGRSGSGSSRSEGYLNEEVVVVHVPISPQVICSRSTRTPLEIDQGDVAIVERDRAMVVDILIAAENAQSPMACSICSRRPRKDAVVHATCRTRLLHALGDHQPFTKARNTAFQDGQCTVCLVRPCRMPGGITCPHCAEIVRVCRSLRCVDRPTPAACHTPRSGRLDGWRTPHFGHKASPIKSPGNTATRPCAFEARRSPTVRTASKAKPTAEGTKLVSAAINGRLPTIKRMHPRREALPADVIGRQIRNTA